MNRRHVLQIAGYASRTSVRGGIGLVFLLLSLTLGLTIAHYMLLPVEQAARRAVNPALYQTEEGRRDAELRAIEEMTKPAKRVVAWMLSTKTASDEPEPRKGRRPSGDDADVEAERSAEFLLEERPALLSGIFLLLLFSWPLVVSFGAFDLYASDIASRQLRYQLLRADRSSIYFGRLLGLCTMLVVVLTALGLTVTLYLGLKLGTYPWGEMLAWTAQGTLMLIVLSLPYVALCGWISASVGGSFTSLTLSSVVIGGVPLLATTLSMWLDAARYLNWLLPWGFQSRLLHHDPLQIGLAVFGCLLQTAVFVWLGHRTFLRRDL
jgi:hypothetical protein